MTTTGTMLACLTTLLLCAGVQAAENDSPDTRSAPATTEQALDADDVRAELGAISKDMDALSRAAKRDDVAMPLAKILQHRARLRQFGANPQLPIPLRAEAWYLAGLAALDINALHRYGGGKVDEAVAIEGLGDLESALALGAKDAAWSVADNAKTLYAGGQIAWNHVQDKLLAGRYWTRCADAGHAGCMNIIAYAYLRGDFGFPIDIEQSVRHHKRVVDTGIQFSCAGFYSALAIATMIHFDGAKTVEGGVMYWLEQGHRLRQALAKRLRQPGACQAVDTIMYINLLQKAEGDRFDRTLASQLDQALGSRRDQPWAALVDYVKGTRPADAIDAAFPPNYPAKDRCDLFFIVVWHAKLSGNVATAESYRAKVAAINDDSSSCALVRRRLALR